MHFENKSNLINRKHIFDKKEIENELFSLVKNIIIRTSANKSLLRMKSCLPRQK